MFRTSQPKRLKTLTEFMLSARYEPPDVSFGEMPTTPQKIVVWTPWFLMSGVGMLHRKTDEYMANISRPEVVDMGDGMYSYSMVVTPIKGIA